jgi:undecaprenyl-diphosphatase
MKKWLNRAFNADARLSKGLRGLPKKHFFSIFAVIFAHSGDSWFWLGGLFLVWLLNKGEWRDWAAFLITGLMVMATVVLILKFAVRRPRPEGEWGQIYRITDPHSFPSGHAARSAALVVMALFVGPPWFAIVVLLWAPWVGLSRVALGVHYLSDVIVGWIVGAVMSLIALACQPWIIQALDGLYRILGI